MTDLQAQALESVVVEQCDRDAAASVLDDFGMTFADDMRSGVDDCDFIVQTFARHRIAALQSRADEVERLREALAGSIRTEACDDGLWSLRFYFGAGDDARSRMRAASDLFASSNKIEPALNRTGGE